MAANVNSCPKCNGKMEQGFIVDLAQGVYVSQWAPGAPKKSFWTKTKLPVKQMIPIGSFRCMDCGFLESYAREEFAAK